MQLQNNKTQDEFVKWIITKNNLPVLNFKGFEIDFEVCFYRDLIFNYELDNKVNLADKSAIKSLLKRTFDICIFLPNDIIIIEAKAAQGMTASQMTEFKYDKLAIETCFDNLKLPKRKVYVIGLVSAEYSTKKIKTLNEGNKYFDGVISWGDIESEHRLKYKQPKKLASVYSETRLRGQYSKGKHELVRDLTVITEAMERERINLKRNRNGK